MNLSAMEPAILTGQLALISAALFAGAALYISMVEQSARLGLDDQSLLMEWKPAYKRGTLIQAPLAVAGLLLGTLTWRETQNLWWLGGGLLMIANLPTTFLIIWPTNSKLIATPIEEAGPTTRILIRRWGALHLIRTGLGLAASATFVYASLNVSTANVARIPSVTIQSIAASGHPKASGRQALMVGPACGRRRW